MFLQKHGTPKGMALARSTYFPPCRATNSLLSRGGGGSLHGKQAVKLSYICFGKNRSNVVTRHRFARLLNGGHSKGGQQQKRLGKPSAACRRAASHVEYRKRLRGSYLFRGALLNEHECTRQPLAEWNSLSHLGQIISMICMIYSYSMI